MPMCKTAMTTIQGTAKEMVDLTANTSIIDSGFDGYKLSLDQLPLHEFKLSYNVRETNSTQDQYSVQHMKLFAQTNYLFFDGHYSVDGVNVFFLILKNNSIIKIAYDCRSQNWANTLEVSSIKISESPLALPPSVVFPDDLFAVVCNGVDEIILFSTEDSRNSWVPVLSFRPCTIDGVSLIEARRQDEYIHVLIQTVVEHEKKSEKDKGLFDNKVYWITLKKDTDWVVYRTRELTQPGHIDTVTLNKGCQHIIVLGSHEPIISNDSQGLTERVAIQPKSMDLDESQLKPVYLWIEKDDEITVTFCLDEMIQKSDVKFSITSTLITLCVKEIVLLDGTLGGVAQPDESTWIITDRNTLEVTIFKHDSSVKWEELVVGDKRGRHEIDPDIIAKASELLERFTSENKALGASGTQENFNSSQLEECDIADDELSSIYWLHGDKQLVTKQCDVTGHQLLFVSRSHPNETARVCLRLDVDGLLWTIDEEVPVHQTTFNAFGYVQASKTLRRFSGCSPNYSYAVIAESNNLAFLYWQATDVMTDLRNRKTCERVVHIAKQQVVSLKRREGGFEDSKRDERILGCFAANNALFLLTGDAVYAAWLK